MNSNSENKYFAIKLRKFDRLCPITGSGDGSIKAGAAVVVQTDRGIEFGEIIASERTIAKRLARDVKLKKVIRYATAQDIAKAGEIPDLEAKAVVVANQKIKEHELQIKIVNVEYLFDTNRVVVYYKVSKSKKIDNLRDLTRDLSSTLKARVEMSQVSPRAEARMLGGMGPCGRGLCCSSWLEKPKHVTVKMVKEQGLALSPTKTSGMCGRLMCCLEYDYKQETKGG
ncbi:hypothetical protein A2291_02305 [candidate division WOR-1 bacterium RIFOXYB2_FULL_42_35]|uniref:PSP1 C-terminal domain-containing protein n=1 Tax=candidate division WOR-1 bacterium RIFOXYC2_FULL_41_25 TaxID=1802586 RepID=A0A1F4TR46_UNCSA|nr:MAG: hypothetical protein A2247_07230 [candidate division WOR-1 bacterium RIFOXYA2_FULL_41_14]OGC25395.1 MAG: hypothetical protein A2291_02305 [candidate division WOR-1 bacterium RIFOXYB2_FULL_42_35]OGC35195.1 MAG: hypothetical protein A2462_07540 [candidate division WOR-1 bacterium RIFOXYC2_FULL_41_25]OGC42983.1 MAG: hypothetical protein A2548_04795 [candidate division WOR-1 bacterium RIFOXYD2_FULL_41_8]